MALPQGQWLNALSTRGWGLGFSTISTTLQLRRPPYQQTCFDSFKLTPNGKQNAFLEFSSSLRAASTGTVLVDDEKLLEDFKPRIDLADRSDDLADVLEILMPVDKFRFHKIPKFKALKLEVTPDLVLQVLEHEKVKPSYKWKFFVWAKRQMEYKHTAETYNSMIRILLDMRKLTSIHFVLEDMHRNEVALTVKSCLRMAKGFGHAGIIDRGVNSLKHMARLGNPATSRHLNILLTALLDGNYHFKAYIAYKEMAASGCEPDGFTFKILLRKLARARELGLACQVYDEMRAVGSEPDAETSSILVSVLCDAGRIDDAVLVLWNFRQSGLLPNARVYDVLLRALSESSRAVGAMEIFDEVRTRGYRLSDDTSTAFLHLLLASGMDGDAQRCREYLTSSNVSACGAK